MQLCNYILKLISQLQSFFDVELEDILTKRFIVDSKAKIKILADTSKNAFAYPIIPNTAKSIITGGSEISVEEGINEALTQLEQFDSSGEDHPPR